MYFRTTEIRVNKYNISASGSISNSDCMSSKTPTTPHPHLLWFAASGPPAAGPASTCSPAPEHRSQPLHPLSSSPGRWQLPVVAYLLVAL